MDILFLVIATGLYSGKLPKAPGTWGSLVALLPCFFMRNLPLSSYLTVTASVFIIGTIAAGAAEKIIDTPDPGSVVIDEIVGIFVTFIAMPAPDTPLCWLLGFLLFRLFDIAKPFPVNWFDQHFHGGLGIMLDDIIAGIYAFCCLQALWWIGVIFFH